ncbi:hypothetical protein JST97_20675 [bacterium]|nr:hypothetical protein [bacterium]
MSIWDSPTLLLVLALGLGLAYTLGARSARVGLDARLAGGALVWTGLSLAVTLYLAGQLHRARLDDVHEECDSIGHVYRALQVLPRNERAQMRLLLVSYTDARLRKVPEQSAQESQNAEDEALGLYSQMFALGTRMMRDQTIDPFRGSQIVQALSQMISIHHRLGYALQERLPTPLLIFVTLQCLASAGLLGALTALSHPQQRWICLVLTGGLWINLALILDYNDPSSQFIRVDTRNIQELSQALHAKERL